MAACCLVLMSLVTADQSAGAADMPRITTHGNTMSAGVLKDGVLTVNLEIRAGEWYPEADDGPHIGVYAYAESGKPPSIPGPLLRVDEGTRIHATVRNTLMSPIALHGFNQRPSKDAPVTLAPGEQHEFDFPAGVPGTYYYWAGPPGGTMGGPTQRWDGNSSQLSGAFIVDERGKKSPDRVFVIGLWRTMEDLERRGTLKEFGTINGKSWPYTERLSFRMGDSARWRWINASGAIHPMHMHGSYYRIEALGNGEKDEPYAPEMRPMVVTHLMTPGSTMETTWSPASPGHWLLHCHLMAHLDFKNSLSALQQQKPAHDHPHAGMVGLVMALDVEGSPKIKNAAYREARKLTLFVEERRAKPLEVKLRLVEGHNSSQSQDLTGPPIVLNRGEPTEITVVNHLAEPTSIHWHGMELESYYDGVPNFTGSGKRLTPLIPPGGKFVARMTPPRSGTFIYHTHWHDVEQLRGGLNGPLLVVGRGGYHPESDQSFVAALGTDDERPLIVNGANKPTALEWRAGSCYHIRLINISPNAPVRFTLASPEEKLTWRVVGKDGMALPPAQRKTGEATQVVAVGETYDIEADVPRAVGLSLRAVIVSAAIPIEANVVEVPIRVR
jgi:FtsP/CotA-like multicopper oxidase with cupredoxin domain